MALVTGEYPNDQHMPNLTVPFSPPTAQAPLSLADLRDPLHPINLPAASGKTRGAAVMLNDNTVWLATGHLSESAWIPLGDVSGGGGYDDTAIKARIAEVEGDVVTQQQGLNTLNQTVQTHQTTLDFINGELSEMQTAINQATSTVSQHEVQLTKLALEATLNKPLPMMPLIVPIGDSRSIQNWNSNTTPVAPLARGPGWIVEMLSQRVRLDSDYMQGVSGDDIEQLLSRIQTDTPGTYGKFKPSEVPPCVMMLLIGTNGVNKGTPLATLMTQLNAVLDWCVAKGHKVMLIAEWPRGAAGNTDNPLSSDNEKLLVAYHNAILRIRRRNVYIVDVWPRVADPASLNAYPRPNMTNGDTLHNSNGISTIQAQEMVRVMVEEMKLPRGKITASSNTDQYNATLMPFGCLNVNPMLRQTVAGVSAGTLASGGAGVAPAGYSLGASAGLTATGSFVPDVLQADGSYRDVFRVVVTGTPTTTNGYFSLRQSGLASKTALNDIIEMNYEVNVSGQKNFAAPGMFIDTGVTATRGHGGLSITGDAIMPLGAIRPYYGVPRATNVTLNPLPANLSMELRPYFTLSGVESGVTCDLCSVSVRKRTAPTYT